MRIASYSLHFPLAVGGLCLSAQMRIASHEARVHQRTGKLCLSAQMRIASAILHKNAISFFADCAVSR
jgi:hypothetical protein